MLRYSLPQDWIKYDPIAVSNQLTAAKAAVLSLTTIPYQRSWVDELQSVQLKRERELMTETAPIYDSLKNPVKALIRDVNALIQLRAVGFRKLEDGGHLLFVRLEWPTEITETEFFRRIKEMPKAKAYGFLDH